MPFFFKVVFFTNFFNKTLSKSSRQVASPYSSLYINIFSFFSNNRQDKCMLYLLS